MSYRSRNRNNYNNNNSRAHGAGPYQKKADESITLRQKRGDILGIPQNYEIYNTLQKLLNCAHQTEKTLNSELDATVKTLWHTHLTNVFNCIDVKLMERRRLMAERAEEARAAAAEAEAAAAAQAIARL